MFVQESGPLNRKFKRKVSPATIAPPVPTSLPPPVPGPTRGVVVAERRSAKLAEDFQLDRNVAYESVPTPKGPWH